MAGGAAEARDIGKAYGLFAGAFALFVTVVAMLAQFGLPRPVIAVLVVMITIVAYAVIGVVARTLSLSEFYVAGRGVPAGLNGMATAAGFLSAAGFLGIAGAFFADRMAGFALAVGWAGGFVLLAVLIAPYYRKSGAVTLPDFLAVRFGNPLLRVAGVIVLLAASLPILAAAIAVAAAIAQHALNIAPEIAITGVLAIILLSSLLGGMRAITLVAGAQAIVILLGILAPAVLLSMQDYGLPVPQITFGYAIAETASAAATPIGIIAGEILPVSGLDGFNLLAVALCLAAGLATLPQVVARSGTTPGVAEARRAAGWSLVVVALIAMTVPAIAAFARLAILRDTVGVELADLPQWIFDYGRLGLVRVCGGEPVSVAAIGTACGASTVLNGLVPGDIALGAEAITLAFADIAGLPYVVTALIAAGALAAALGAASAALLTIAASLGHDVYGRLLDRRAPAGRRLIVSRLLLIAVAALGAWLAVNRRGDMFAFTSAAPSLAAAGFFPAIVLGVWWRRTTFWGVLAGTVAGFAVTAAYVLMTRSGAMPLLRVVGLTDNGISAAASAVIGVPLGFIVAVIVSLLTPAPGEVRLEVVDAIRRPSPDPVLEDHAA
jgi:cation/acetate symporter